MTQCILISYYLNPLGAYLSILYLFSDKNRGTEEDYLHDSKRRENTGPPHEHYQVNSGLYMISLRTVLSVNG